MINVQRAPRSAARLMRADRCTFDAVAAVLRREAAPERLEHLEPVLCRTGHRHPARTVSRKSAMAELRDMKADWRRWTLAEKWTAMSFAFATSAAISTLLIFGQG